MVPIHSNYLMDWTEDSVRLIATPSGLAKSAFFYVQEVGHFFAREHYFTEREHVQSFLMVYTVQGGGKLRYRGETHSLRAGQVFFIDCSEYYQTSGEELWEMYWVHFQGSSSRIYYEQFMEEQRPVLQLPEDNKVAQTIEQLIRLYMNKDARTELQSSNLIVQLLTELLFYRMSGKQAEHQTFLPDYVEGMKAYIEKNTGRKLTLDELSRQFSVSKFHLSREFKKFTGLTPHEYLLISRMNRTKELLKYSDLPVAEIAIDVGFDNVSHFIKQFKAREDMTPLFFRKRWQLVR